MVGWQPVGRYPAGAAENLPQLARDEESDTAVNQYDEDDVIEFARETVNRFADALLERATSGLPPDAVLSCRALQRIVNEERARWLRQRHPGYPKIRS